MVVDPTAHTTQKISGGSWKYRKEIDQRKGDALGVAKRCKAMGYQFPFFKLYPFEYFD